MASGVHDLSIKQFRIRNYRVLKDVTFGDISRLTVLCGPNGSGKSTVFDVFAHPGGLPKIFLAEHVARHLNVEVNRSRSFAHFRDGVRRLVDPERVA